MEGDDQPDYPFFTVDYLICVLTKNPSSLLFLPIDTTVNDSLRGKKSTNFAETLSLLIIFISPGVDY